MMQQHISTHDSSRPSEQASMQYKTAELHKFWCTVRASLLAYANSLGPVGQALLCSALTSACFSMEKMAELQPITEAVRTRTV